MSNDYPGPVVPSDTVLHIAIACFGAGVAYALDQRPPPIVGDDPTGTWVRLARLAYENQRVNEPPDPDAPDWLKQLYRPKGGADERD